jgi:DNA-binding beta-propeller fold protein YncE
MAVLLAMILVGFAPRAAFAGTGNPPFILQWGGVGSGLFSDSINPLAHGLTGNIYVLETAVGFERVTEFDNNGVFITRWGMFGSGPGEFASNLGAIAVGPDGSVYTADNRIQKFTSSGVYIAEFSSIGTGDGQFGESLGMDTDAAGNVYVADEGNDRVDIFSSSGLFLGKWGISGTGPGQLHLPISIAVEHNGNVLVGDGTGRLQRFTGLGVYLATLATNGSGDGQIGCCPLQTAVDADGRIFVTDWQHNRVVVFAPDGSFGTQWGALGTGPGQFNGPAGVTADAEGNVFVFDRENQRVQKFGYVTPTLSTTWGRIKAIYK